MTHSTCKITSNDFLSCVSWKSYHNTYDNFLCKLIHISITELRLLFVRATEHALLRILKNILRQILFPGDLHDAAL